MNTFSIDNLLNRRSVKSLLSLFDDKKGEIRLVGGCVRDTLLNRDIKDIDAGTTIELSELIKILKKKNLKYEDYAYRYGSIIVYLNDEKIQITKLREDIKQMGRHTDIVFTNSWEKDALRRDFTFNAIYLSFDGKIFDYFNGQNDLLRKKVKFIGDIEARLKEDYLRIYRYYRFLGLFDFPKLENENENILKKYSLESFIYLSNDIIRQEVLKMFKMPFAVNCFFKNIVKKDKRNWLKNTNNHFIKTKYDLGLKKCLNKIEVLIN